VVQPVVWHVPLAHLLVRVDKRHVACVHPVNKAMQLVLQPVSVVSLVNIKMRWVSRHASNVRLADSVHNMVYRHVRRV